jgi:hypothetical protein
LFVYSLKARLLKKTERLVELSLEKSLRSKCLANYN